MTAKTGTRHTNTSVDERAVSPVVGVSLLVGMSVILIAAISLFVFGSVPGDPQPNAELVYQHDDSSTELGVIGHARGDTISGDTLVVLIEGDVDAELTPSDYEDGDTTLDPEPNSGLTQGDRITIDDSTVGNDPEYNLTVIHEPTNSILLESGS